MSDELKRLNRQADRVARLLDAAIARQGEAWDKPAGVGARIDRTVAKHQRTLDRLEAQIARLEAEVTQASA